MNKETARMWLLMTTPSLFLVSLPDFLGVSNIKPDWTTFRFVYDCLVVFLFSWSVTTLLYLFWKGKS